MKKTITLILFALCLTFQQTFAQIEITGSETFGRIFDLTYDVKVPNKIYAITLGNHIVVSEDNGITWDVLYAMNLLQGATITQMKLSADGTALTFAVFKGNTTENAVLVYDIASASIIKTFALPNQADLAYVESYDFYDANMDVLLLDTSFPNGFNTEGKTFYTADGGVTWDNIYYTNDYDTVFIQQVAISPNNPDKIFLTRGNGKTDIDGGIFISEDAGKTFVEKLPGIVLDPIVFDPSNDQTIFLGTGISFGGTVENLYKSTDEGDTFNIVPITWTEGILDNITVIKINENNPSQILILEENEIAISEDGGSTFQNIVYPEENPESYYYGLNASYNPQNAREIMISSNYFPLISTDGAVTVSKIQSPYFVSTGKIDLFRNDTNSNLYYGVQDGYVLRDLDNNKDTPYKIKPLNEYSSNGGKPNFIDQIVPNRIYSLDSGFTGASFNVSSDNGLTQNNLLSLYTNKISSVATFPNDTKTILVAFSGYDPSETILKLIDFNDLNAIQVIDIRLPASNFINGILIDSSDKITLTVGAEVYTSEDNGLNWENSSKGLEALDKTDLIFDLEKDPLDTNKLALATSKGVFVSENGGLTWNQKSKQLVHNVAFSTEKSGAMMASTYNSEVSIFEIHYSTDSGESWLTINNEQLLSITSFTSSYYFYEDSVKVFVGTSDIGLMEYSIDLNVLGVPEFEDVSNEMFIYPNPTKGMVSIRLKNSNVSNAVIYTLSGSKVMEFNGISNIDISNLTSGIYLLRVQDSNKDVFFKRIVKQ